MNKLIYYRKSLMDKTELTVASKYFKCVSLLTDIEPNDIVVYRYSLYPFPADQEKEILNIGATPINRYNQHLYVSDLKNYVYDLDGLTPFTWLRLEDLPDNGPFVLKGETNSKKSKWSTHMFAETKKDAIAVHTLLSDDGLIGDQSIYIRQYVPLKTYMIGLNGMPIAKEFRFFVAFGEVISGGYYWQNYVDDIGFMPDAGEVPKEFLNTVISRIRDKIDLVVIDVAQTTTGDWIVIELNSLNQSGESCNDLDQIYCGLRDALDRRFV